MAAILAIDLGTTGCRSIVYGESMKELGSCYREYELCTPCPGWAQQDAERWWQLTLETARGAIAESGIDSMEVVSISVSSQGITVVPVDRQITPLAPAMTWLDTRAIAQTSALQQKLGKERCFSLTGKPLEPVYTLPKILWIRDEQKEIFDKTWKFLMPMDFLLARLTGVCVTDHSMASGTLLYDIAKQDWSREILTLCGLSEALLPELKWSGETAGTILPEVARQLGLREDCLVAVGAQDQKCADLGVDLKTDQVVISLGTSAAVSRCWPAPDIKPGAAIPWSAYVKKDAWITEGVIHTAGACMRWVRDRLFPGCSYDEIDAEAEMARSRGERIYFYPFLNGSDASAEKPERTGNFYGFTLSAQRGDLALAVMEGVAFQIRAVIEEMGGLDQIRELLLVGGGAKSPLWCQIIADAVGKPVVVPQAAEAAGRGAGILAGIAAGIYTWQNKPEVAAEHQYLPSGDRMEWESRFAGYREIERKLWS